MIDETSRFNRLATRMLARLVPVIALLALGCARAATDEHPGHPESEASHEAGAETAEHPSAEISDLDRTVESLMSDRCEHEVPTYQCDECRYEVGIVKVAPDLLDEDGPLQTTHAVRRTTEESVAHNGEVRLNEERAAYLSPRMPGTVRSILVDLGAAVRQGQVLFTVDSPEFGEARSAFLIAQASLKLAEGTAAREKDLYEKKVCPRKDLLEAEASRDGARATCQAARERLLACGLGAEEIAQLSSDGARAMALPVKAPFDGTVLERNLNMGALVEPGQHLLLLGDTSEMWVWTSLYERELPGLLREQAKGAVLAHVEVPAYPDRLFSGRVERMSGTVDEATRTARVRVVVGNPEGLLRAGMFARVHLHGNGSADALTVPAEAVLEDEGRAFVFVPAEPPYFIRRPVLTGRAWGEWVEVTQGLADGDVVVARGAFTLKSDVLRSKMGAGCAD